MIAFFEFFYQRDHFGNMFRCARRNFRPFATQRVKVLPERVDILRGVFVERLSSFAGLGNDAVVDISEVHYLRHPPAFELQIAPHQVCGDGRAKISDVAKIPDRRAAVIELYFAFNHRAKLFKLAGESVMDAQHCQRV